MGSRTWFKRQERVRPELLWAPSHANVVAGFGDWAITRIGTFPYKDVIPPDACTDRVFDAGSSTFHFERMAESSPCRSKRLLWPPLF